MDELWLAFEGGGTKTRILLARPNGEILASESGGCSNGYYIEPVEYSRKMCHILRRLRETAEKVGGGVTVVGLAGPMNAVLVKETISEILGPARFIEAGEARIALACHGLDAGIALIAGTGSSCTACNEQGERANSGGFGPQFDDVGSAYWIGREAVTAILRSEDGRGPFTALRERLFAYAGIEHLWELLQRCDRNGHVPRQFIAGFAPEVFEAARQGDTPARVICREAGKRLGELVIAVANKTKLHEPVPVVPSGGVFHGATLILPSLRRALKATPVKFKIFPIVLEPAPGIFRIIATETQGGRARVS